MKTVLLLTLMIGMAFLTACTPQPPRTDPLTGIVNWSELPEAVKKQNPFSQSSLGIILSDNVEQQIKSYRGWLGSFNRGHYPQKELDILDFKTGATQMVQMLNRNFKKLMVTSDLNECIGMRLDYCAVLDWNREVDWTGFSAKTTLQLILLNSKAERLTSVKAASDWHHRSRKNNLAGYAASEEIALTRLEQELHKISP